MVASVVGFSAASCSSVGIRFELSPVPWKNPSASTAGSTMSASVMASH